ncbi:Protein FAM184A, partial [Exaiptasia diaphana]
LSELDNELSGLKQNVTQLEDELQEKGYQILKIRRETNSQIRKREEHLGKLHQKEVDSLSSDHLKETQALVEEFNRAKDLQNSKISALQLMLDEAEIRFQNRESRPEDMEMLDTLKRALADRELEMKKLLEEKRYFQMELLNRETNFNKVFNSSPQVGVINPLNSKTSIKKTVNKNTGILMSSSRLDPIPNMPLHERRLTKTKPLPPTPPKDGQRRPVVY